MQKKITVVMLGVRNMDRAVRFYRSVLKLPLKFQTPDYSEFKTGGAVLALEKRKKVAATGASITLPTRNIRRDRQALIRHKVKFWKPLHREAYGWVMMPKDSEGNIFEIVQYAKLGK